MTDFNAFPGIGQWPNSMNLIFEQGKAMPSWDHGAMTNSADVAHYFIANVVEAQNPDGNPRNYAFANNVAFYEEDGIRTTDQTFTTGCVVQGACMVEGPPITAASGTIPARGAKKLLVSFGATVAGLAETTRYRDPTTDSSPWSAAVAASTATAATMFLVIPVGADLIAATGSGASSTNLGRTALGEYRIAKCPAGNDPTLAASYVNITSVGTPEWPINSLCPLYDSYVVGKGDGAYFWNDRTKRHQPVFRWMKILPHALNCKGMSPAEGGVWIPLADGRVFKFDGVTAREETPTKGIVVPRDFYTNRITSIVDKGDVVAMRSEPFYNSLNGPRAAAALNLKVITYINGTFADITTNVTNGKLSDGGSLNNFGISANDRIFIGADTPLEAVTFRITRKPNAAAIKFGTPRYSNAVAGSSGPFTTSFTGYTAVRDGTILGTSTISCALTGYPPGASEAIIQPTDINTYDLMLSTALTFAAPVSATLTKYWMALTPAAGGTGMTSTTEVDEIDIVPCRGGLPNSGLLTSATNYSHRHNAGGLGLIHMGKNIGGKYIWQTPFAVDDGGGVWAMSFTASRTGTMTNGGQPLLLWGRYQQTIIAVGINGDPSRTPYPKLVQGGSGKPFPTLAVRKLQLGDPLKQTRVNKITVWGEYIQQGDQIGLYAWFDNEDYAIDLDLSKGAPWTFVPPAKFPVGRELNFDILFYDSAQTEATAPYISHVIVDWDDVDEPLQPDSNLSALERI